MRWMTAAALTACLLAADRPRLRPVPAISKGFATGPDIGQPIPAFSLPDQSGTARDFASLRGKNGLVLAFVRSADW